LYEPLPAKDEALFQEVQALVRACGTILPSSAAVHVSFVVLIPLYYNPDGSGVRKAIEQAKLRETETEIREHFSGYSRSTIDGWYRENDTEFSDQLLRYEIVFVPSDALLRFLARWKRRLEARFAQRAIYMAFAGPVMGW
jgi:hypothetical protein